MAEPKSHDVIANDLTHHVLEWEPSNDDTATQRSTHDVAVLIHGFMDAAGTWDGVAPTLANAGLRVFAPDMRGFGKGPRAPEGSYYHFADYIADLVGVIDGLGLDSPFYLVGHSMGGAIATYFSGAFPERVSKVALLEGMGPPDNPIEVARDRMRRWLDDVALTRSKREASVRTSLRESDAYRRLVLNHPQVPPDVLRSKLRHLVRDLGDGTVAWRFDPLHKTTSPMPFSARYFMSFAARITCPVLAVGGGPEGYHPPDEGERLAAFRTCRHTEIAGAGHMMHWTQPDALAALLVDFWREPSA